MSARTAVREDRNSSGTWTDRLLPGDRHEDEFSELDGRPVLRRRPVRPAATGIEEQRVVARMGGLSDLGGLNGAGFIDEDVEDTCRPGQAHDGPERRGQARQLLIDRDRRDDTLVTGAVDG